MHVPDGISDATWRRVRLRLAGWRVVDGRWIGPSPGELLSEEVVDALPDEFFAVALAVDPGTGLPWGCVN